MEITQVTPDDAEACAAAVGVVTAAFAVDCPELVPPTPRSFAAALKHGWDGDPPRTYLGRDDDGVPVGVLETYLPTYDNQNLAWMEVDVHPDHRGRGHGSELLAYGEQTAAAQGRTLLGLSQWDLPKADAFARRHRFEPKSVEVVRRQELANLDWTTVQKLYDEAAEASADYELLRLTGRLPDELLEDMVALTASINDAPKDDLEMEDDVYSADRLRAYEAAQLGRDVAIRRVVARQRGTGALAGHTTIVVEQERPYIGHQHDTAVDRAHRGHRLGALVKTAMLLWLREVEPALSQIDTWNAESNDHMIGINEQLGYRILARAHSYQKTV